MSQQITEWNVIDYKSTVDMLLQQRGSKLLDAITIDSYHGKSGVAVNQYGSVAAQEVVTRHADTPLVETPFTRRWVFPRNFAIADLIDDNDKLRTIADPSSPIALAQAMAIGRKIDDLIIAAAIGTAKTGEDGATSVALPASQTAPTVAGGLTVAKLREAKKLLLAAEVDIDNEALFCVIGAQQHDDLLGETQAVNLDFTNKPVLVDGRIKSFMGFNFIDSQRLPLTGTDRTVLTFAKSGMHMGMWGGTDVTIAPRPDKNNNMQILTKKVFGATRLEEKKIVAITSSEL